MAEDDEIEEEQLEMPVIVDEPEQGLDLSEYEIGGKSLEEAEEENPHQTDLQYAMRAIIPKFENKRMDKLLQPIMQSRVFPDNYLDLNAFVSLTLIEELEGQRDIDVVGIITGVQVAASKAYEGKHIVDILEIAGVAHEEELEKLSNQLGI